LRLKCIAQDVVMYGFPIWRRGVSGFDSFGRDIGDWLGFPALFHELLSLEIVFEVAKPGPSIRLHAARSSRTRQRAP
jgi:hypothetical protein